MNRLTKSAALAAALLPLAAFSADPPTITVKVLMTKIVEPASNAVFYVSRQPPQNDAQWLDLQGKTLMLAEIADSLLSPARAKDNKRWLQDAKLFVDAANAAYAAANAKNVQALEDLNDALYTACSTCHEHYLPKR